MPAAPLLLPAQRARHVTRALVRRPGAVNAHAGSMARQERRANSSNAARALGQALRTSAVYSCGPVCALFVFLLRCCFFFAFDSKSAHSRFVWRRSHVERRYLEPAVQLPSSPSYTRSFASGLPRARLRLQQSILDAEKRGVCFLCHERAEGGQVLCSQHQDKVRIVRCRS